MIGDRWSRLWAVVWQRTEALILSRRHKQAKSIMNSLVVSAVLLASTLGGLIVGIILRSVLPDPHLNSDSKDVIKMGTGLVAAVTGLVLGLLTASAKSSYDGQRANLH